MISHIGRLRCSKPVHSRNGRRLPPLASLAVALLVAACQTVPPPAPPPAAAPPSVKTLTQARYERVAPESLPRVADADLAAAWPALLASCSSFERHGARRAIWGETCRRAAAVPSGDDAAQRLFLGERLDAYRVLSVTLEDGSTEQRLLATEARGRMTGYYEPLLSGSRAKAAPYLVPLHRPPADLLTIDLSPLFPELANQRLRGRLQQSDKGQRVVPYWTRADLTEQRLRGAELLWVDDAIEAFFLQVQGSGRVRFRDGSMTRVGYADTNGHPYRSIGRVLVERGELPLEQASMQGIKAWARANPRRVAELLNENPSYVFFRELPLGDPNAGPLGALGVPLTPGYSVAVDPRFIPLGAPLLVSSEHPVSGEPLRRLMLAQDTGGAIRGPLRFDFFWGFGAEAAVPAGRQRHDVQAWLLVPRGVAPEKLLGS
ncbi:MAG: MltA domain-containing protein [Burkholderiales bacterium]|jgi:membrane-bound lytic murein transglycosylase A|nr:MltA domain-containing protein [Burkholderiales bacterium]